MGVFLCADANHEAAAEAIENMADAVTHARFVGTDPASDEVVLMKILQVQLLQTCPVCSCSFIWSIGTWNSTSSPRCKEQLTTY